MPPLGPPSVSTFGSAPHRVLPGVWITFSGRKLTPAGNKYWEQQFRLGATDGRGHYDYQVGNLIKQARAGSTRAGQQLGAIAQKKQGSSIFGGLAHAAVAAYHDSPAGAIQKAVQHPSVGNIYRALNPVANITTHEGKQTDLAAKRVATNVAKGKAPGIGDTLTVAGSIPFFGRASKAAKAIEEAAQAERAAAKVGPLTAKESAAADVRAALDPLEHKAALQKDVISYEKRQRLTKAGQAYQEAGGGTPGFEAWKREMAGPYTKLRLEGLEHWTPEQIHSLKDMAFAHPHESEFFGPNVANAIDKLHRGEIVQDAELDKLRQVFGAEEVAPVAEANKAKRFWYNMTLGVLNIPRSIQASLDASLGLRQALPLAMSHPVLWGKEYGGSFKYLGFGGGEGRYARDMESLGAKLPRQHQTVEGWINDGLSLTDLGKGVAHREEQFQSPVAETLTGGKRFSPIRMSGRIYTGGANRMRIVYANHLLDKAIRGGTANTPKLRKDIAKLANVVTGRGALPGRLEGSAPLLNALFFSPRLFASRIELVAKSLYLERGVHPFVRREAQKSLIKMTSALVGIVTAAWAAGAQVGTDPRSANFGKILPGGNLHIDPWGGFQQPVRAAAQIASGKKISTVTGKTMPLSGGYGKSSPWDVGIDFVESKFSPGMRILMDVGKKHNSIGQPTTLKGEATSMLIPLSAQDAWDAYKQTHSALLGLGMFGLAGTGVGVQAYEPKAPKSKAKKSQGGGSWLAPEPSRSRSRSRGGSSGSWLP